MALVKKNLSTQLLVIGGGATGLGIAWDASLRGIKTVLIEQSDIGQGTSGRYHGLLHSGGRYAISDPVSAADCARENQIVRTIAAPAVEETGGYFVSTPTDPLQYPDQWREACEQNGIFCEELTTSTLLSYEPLVNPRIARVFRVLDASLDSFDLVHLLVEGIRQAGGKILLHHKVTSIKLEKDRLQSVEILDRKNNEKLRIEAEFVINATGPWVGRVAALARLDIPIALGKGTMLAMAHRLTHAVINRCKPPSDGDIIVPVGTVCVLGTTDVRVENPDQLDIEPWELELLITEAEILIPGISNRRALRAWAGVRALDTHEENEDDNRSLRRSHVILDHRDDGIENFISVYGGKLTTFRSMAEEATDIAARRLMVATPSATATTLLPPQAHHKSYSLPRRLELLKRSHTRDGESLICECELVSAADLQGTLTADGGETLDDLRRDLRLGMGPCQAAFCGYRAAGFMKARDSERLLSDFTQERWKGMRALVWGSSLRQIELNRRVNRELLQIEKVRP